MGPLPLEAVPTFGFTASASLFSMDFLNLLPAFFSAVDGSATAETSRLLVIANKFGLDPMVILAQVANFAVVTYVLWKFAIRPVVATIDERQARIAEGLQHAEEMKLRLDEAAREKEETLREASVEAQRIVGEATTQAKEKIDKSVEVARKSSEEVLRKAEASIEADRKKMLDETKAEIARLVVLTSSRVLNRELTSDERETYSKAASQELTRN